MSLGNARRTRIRVGDSILYGLLDPVVFMDHEDYSLMSTETFWYGHMEFILEGNGSIINLPVSDQGQIGWTETT